MYDDDDEEAEPGTAPVAKEEANTTAPEADLVPKFTKALNAALVALEYFPVEPAAPQQSGEGESDENGQLALPPGEAEAAASKPPAAPVAKLDSYNTRPLPYVIGTRHFLEDNSLGLEWPLFDAEEKTVNMDSSESSSEESSSESDTDSSDESDSGSESSSGSDSESDSESDSASGSDSDNERTKKSVVPVASAPQAPPMMRPPIPVRPIAEESEESERSDTEEEWVSIFSQLRGVYLVVHLCRLYSY